MNHSGIGTLCLLIGMYLTACHSATSEKPKPKTDSIATFPDFAYIADDRYVVLTTDADSNWAASAPVLVKADAGLYWSSASDVQSDKIPAQFRSLINQQIRVCKRNGESYLTNITGFKRYFTDLDNDGIPEIIVDKGLGETAVLKQAGNEWIETHNWKIPYHDCPC